MKKLPSFLKRYFWDVDFKKLDISGYSEAIIGRLLEYGDEKAVRWLLKHFAKKKIKDCLGRFRFVSPKSANYWVLVLKIPRNEVPCLQKHYLKTRKKHWPY